jgi:SPP1 gp7 family putative phage head morphogenesis protein
MANSVDNEDLQGDVEYSGSETAVFKEKYLTKILDSIGPFECEGRDRGTYRRMLRDDGQVASGFEVLRVATLARGYDINYHGKKPELGSKMVEYIEWNFDNVNTQLEYRGGFTLSLHSFFDAVWAGYAVQEVVWYYNEERKQVCLKKLKPLPPEHISFRTNEKDNLLGVYLPYFSDQGTTEEEKKYGVKIPLNRSLIWTFNKEQSSYKGVSAFAPIYKYWYLKDFILKFWSIFTERYGAPFVFGLTKKKRMGAMKTALKKIMTKTEFVGIKDQDELKILETAHDGNHFEKFIEYCDEMILRGILVPSLIIGAGNTKGTKTLGQTHFGVFEWRINDMQRQLEDVVNLLIKWMIDLNFKDVDVYPTITFRPLTETDRRTLAQTFDLLIKNLVISPFETWMREELGLPDADKETVELLKRAWEMKQQSSSSFSPSTGTSPYQGDNRAYSPDISELTERLKKRTSQLKASSPELLLQVVKTLDDEEEKLVKKLEPEIEKMKKAWIKEVKKNMKTLSHGKYGKDDMNFQGHPEWVENLEPITNPRVEVVFSDWYDDALDASVLNAEDELVKLGMEPSWTAKSRVGRSKWIEENLVGLREGSQDMAQFGSNKIPIDMYDNVYPKLQEWYAEGLQENEIVSNLEAHLDTHYSKSYLQNVARTNMTTMFNSARMSLYERRSDFVTGVEHSSILDDRTTKICDERDGTQYRLDDPNLRANTPPLHYQCRSILTPITILDKQPTWRADDAIYEFAPQEGFGGVLTAVV